LCYLNKIDLCMRKNYPILANLGPKTPQNKFFIFSLDRIR
jgi:hypothetical protein